MNKIIKTILIFTFLFSLIGCKSKDSATKEIRMGRVNYATHGTNSFALITVALEGTTILDVYIDEFQYFQENTVIPIANSDGMSRYLVKGIVLASKRVNNEKYSESMQIHGSAKNDLSSGYLSIQKYVRGMSIDKLKETLEGKNKELVLEEDIVAGSTLEDTYSYLLAIIEACEETLENEPILYTKDTSKLTIKTIDYAVNDNNSFAITSILIADDQIVNCYIDEYQYLSSNNNIPLANYEGMADKIVDGYILTSKRLNAETYDKASIAIGSATNSIIDNYEAVQDFVIGKSISELESLIDEKTSTEILEDNMVTGCTFRDILDYLLSVIEASKT